MNTRLKKFWLRLRCYRRIVRRSSMSCKAFQSSDSLFAYQCTACSLEMLKFRIFCIKSGTQSTCFSFRSACDIIRRPATPGWCSTCSRIQSHHCSRLILEMLSQEWSSCEVLLSRWALMGALPHSLADSSHLDHVGKVKVKVKAHMTTQQFVS